MLVGDVPEPSVAEPALRWASARGIPVIAEPFGEHPHPGVLTAGLTLLTDAEWLAAHEPDLVLVVGRPTLTRPVTALIQRTPRLLAVDSGVEFGVPGRDLERIGPDALADLDMRPHEGWSKDWADRSRAVSERLGATTQPWGTSLAVAQIVSRSLPTGSRIFLGSSNAVRDVALVGEFAAGQVDVVASRGLAGIDGCVSTAIGLALADPDRPTYALLGDLTLLHDTNGLLIGLDESRPDLTIVVPNDDGGGIFTLLEPGVRELAGPFDRIFGTPTGTDLAALCRAHGIRHELIDTADRLAAAITEPPCGISVLEVRVDRHGHRAAHAALRALARG